MEKREKAVLKRERREQRKQATDDGVSTFSDPAEEADEEADVEEPEAVQTTSIDGEKS